MREVQRRQRIFKVSAYNSGLMGIITKKRFQKRIAAFVLFFMMFQILSPLGSIIHQKNAMAAAVPNPVFYYIEGGLKIHPDSGTHVPIGTTIYMKTSLSTAHVYYTSNGTTPTSSSTNDGATGMSTFSLPGTRTLKAIAGSPGYTQSSVVTVTYSTQCADPQMTPPATFVSGGTMGVAPGTQVNMNGDGFCTIYYTTDGSTPTTSSTHDTNYLNSPTFTLPGTRTIKALGAGTSGMSSSNVTSYTYFTQDNSPTFTPVSGSAVNTGGKINIINNDSSFDTSTIYYTTDGSTPSATHGTAVTAGANGQYTITETGPFSLKAIAVSSNGLVSSSVATASYTITDSTVAVTGVSVLPATLGFSSVGSTGQLTATVTPNVATNKNVIWLSNNSSVATVDSSGLVTSVGGGTASILVMTEDGSYYTDATVTVGVPVTGVSVSPATISLIADGTSTGQLTATIAPDNATNEAVTWSSSNDAIATVDASGAVTPVAAGTATITATTHDGNFTDSSAVTVAAQDTVTSPTITTQPANQTVTAPATATFTVAADNGGGTLSYKWQIASAESDSFTNISSATDASYTTPATTANMSGTQYRVVVTNSAGGVTSSVVTLSVNAAGTYDITSGDTSVSRNGATVNFTTLPTNVGTGFNVSITPTTTSSHSAPTGKTLLEVYDVTPSIIPTGTFSATITLAYPTGQTYKSGDTVLYWDGSSWSSTGIVVTTHTTNSITFTTSHFSDFAIMTASSTTGATTTTTTSTTPTTLPVSGTNVIILLLNMLMAGGLLALMVIYTRKTKLAFLLS